MTSSPGVRGWNRLQSNYSSKSVTDDDRRRQTPESITMLPPYTMCRRASNKKSTNAINVVRFVRLIVSNMHAINAEFTPERRSSFDNFHSAKSGREWREIKEKKYATSYSCQHSTIKQILRTNYQSYTKLKHCISIVQNKLLQHCAVQRSKYFSVIVQQYSYRSVCKFGLMSCLSTSTQVSFSRDQMSVNTLGVHRPLTGADLGAKRVAARCLDRAKTRDKTQ